MPRVRAVLLDVFDTVLTVDFDRWSAELAEASGVPKDAWSAVLGEHHHGLMSGAVTPEEVFAAALEHARHPTTGVEALVRLDGDLLIEHASIYPDVIPFLDEVRGRAIGVAFVSNCLPNTRRLLDTRGLEGRADRVVLSCDVGAVKPDAGIYLAALDSLDAVPAETLFVDDQAAYCSGAEALGIASVLIDRRDPHAGAVSSLADVLAML